MTKQPAVYILASKRNGTLYIGVTSDLQKRAWEHKQDLVDGFTKRNAVHRLVYYELHENMLLAIQREKQIKKWNRAWKLELIEKHNSDWSDLWPAIVWIPAFARMTEDAINVAPLRTKAKREIQEWLTSSIQNPKFKSVWLT